jgi:mitochondrial-processing peptidase subunit alpha
MEKTGATVSASSGREEIVYRAEGLRHSIPKLFDLMTDSVLYGRLHDFDLPPKVDLVNNDIETFENVPEYVLNEALHRTAFNQKGLGNTLLCPIHQLDSISTDTIKEYMDKNFVANRITISATNFNHEDLVLLSKQLYSELPSVKETATKSEPVYTGGDLRINKKISYAGEEAHSVLAFKGVSSSSQDLFALTVLSNIMGDFERQLDMQTKGKRGQLMQKINSNEISKAKGFNLSYSDSGLFGVYLAGSSESVGKGLVVAKEILANYANNEICDVLLNRGINKSVFEVLSSMETNTGAHEFYLKNSDDRAYVEKIKKVTKEDVKRVAKLVMSSKPTLVSYGNLEHVPTTFDL